MRRTTVMIDEDLDARLRYEARRRGVSMAEVVREAVERHLTREQRELSFVALGEGGPADASERVDEYVARAVKARRRTR